MFSFTGLGNHPLRAPDEPRVAGIAWEMAHEDRWMPYLGGAPFLEHPPLFYVVLGAFIERFGATETVARLPGAIASVLTLLLVFALGARLANPVAGLAGLLALVGMGGFFRYTHRALVDPLLMLWVMVGFYAYVRAVWGTPSRAAGEESDARVSVGWLGVVYLAAALAYYVKGFVGVVAIGGPLAVDALVARRWKVILSPAHLAGVPLLCAACAAWPLALYRSEGEASLRAFLVHNGLYRIVPGAPDYIGGHAEPFWYYLRRLPDQVGWIALFVPATAAWLFRGDAPATWRLPALRFLAAVLPVGVLLLTLPGTKRGLYLLPFQPPLAVAIGAWIAAVGCSDAHRSRVERAVASLCALVARGVLSPLARLASIVAARRPDRKEADPAHYLRDLRDDVSRAAVGACRGPYRIAVIGFAISVACYLLVYPFVNQRRNLGPMAREVDARVGTHPLVGIQLEESVRGALAFYAGRIVSSLQDAHGLAQSIEPGETGYLLAPVWMRDRIEDALGHSVAVAGTWKGGHSVFSLYALSPPQSLAVPGLDANSEIEHKLGTRTADARRMAQVEPSIKGSTIASVVEDVRQLRDSGRIPVEKLETRLEAADLALLDAKVQPALWYPIASYRRLSELLLESEGRGNPQYLADRGARAAERLWEAGLYVQLQHGEEKAELARKTGGVLSERDARLITSLSGAIFNFSRWSYRTDGPQALIEVTEAEALPEVSIHAARGFLEYVVGRLRKIDTAVHAERPTPDRVVFRFRVAR